MKNVITYKPNITKKDNKILTPIQTITEQNKRYSNSSFFKIKNPMKTTHKPSQELQQDHNTVKIQLCEKRHKTVSF